VLKINKSLETKRKHFEYLIKTLDNQIEILKKHRKELEKEMKKHGNI
jgi:peptidoglycan hydrolase CwlO-like protein